MEIDVPSPNGFSFVMYTFSEIEKIISIPIGNNRYNVEVTIEQMNNNIGPDTISKITDSINKSKDKNADLDIVFLTYDENGKQIDITPKKSEDNT